MTVSHAQLRSGIGRAYREHPRIALAVGVITVAVDYALVRYRFGEDVRACMALMVFAAAIYFANGDLSSVGLRAAPVQGWRPWIRISLQIAVLVAACVAGGMGTWSALGNDVGISVTAPDQVWTRGPTMCFVAPVLEETIYRIAACGLVVTLAGSRATIVANGVLFGFLHVLYGNASPENLVAGFFLAWAFLKSETVLVPLMLHCAGNLLALASQLVGWYLINNAG